MARSITLLMRFVFFLMLFQFTAPALLATASTNFSNEQFRLTGIRADQSHILLQILLKENEDKEFEKQCNEITVSLLLNFNDHSSAILALHKSINNVLYFKLTHTNYFQRSLSSLFCTYLI
jgi:hypothetical protein